jgi:hypothetical protein
MGEVTPLNSVPQFRRNVPLVAEEFSIRLRTYSLGAPGRSQAGARFRRTENVGRTRVANSRGALIISGLA